MRSSAASFSVLSDNEVLGTIHAYNDGSAMLSSSWPRRRGAAAWRAALFQYSGAGVLALVAVLEDKVQLAPGHPRCLGAATLTISTPEVSAIILVMRVVLNFCSPGRRVGEQAAHLSGC